MRFRFFALPLLLLCTLAGAAAASAADAPRIRLVPILTRLTRPLACVDDGSGRLFIVEQPGRILLSRGGRLESQPFLDLQDRVYSRDNECGLLGLAFHPDFKNNGRFFVNYTTKQNGKLETVVAEFHADAASAVANANSERVILRFDQPWANHNGGNVMFGPDGFLYIGNGDGGSGGDPMQNGQSLKTWLGKMLRIDVDHAPAGKTYAIPADNPFAKNTDGTLPEIWCYGLRNPWRWSFDRQTGELWCGDVGQNLWEEIDVLEKGRNYGWSAREGMHDFKPERARGPLAEPVKEYGRGEGNCVTGGFVYRGKSIPALAGIYLYADYTSGNIWGLHRDAKGAIDFDAKLIEAGPHIASFGQDRDGELYVCDHAEGRILRIAP